MLVARVVVALARALPRVFRRNSSFSLSMSLSGRSDDREAVRRILSDGHAPFAGDGNGSDLGDSRCRRQSLPCGVLPAGAVFEGFAEEHDWAHVSQEHWHDLHPPSERRDSDPATPDRQLLDLFATQVPMPRCVCARRSGHFGRISSAPFF